MSNISDFQFNLTASFYTLKNEDAFSSEKIKSILDSASATKEGGAYYLRLENQAVADLDGVTYSIVAFKTKNPPYIIKKDVLLTDDWLEVKFAFFLVVRYGKYIAISRKYVSIPDAFLMELQTIDYKVFANFLVGEETSFQKFGMLNLDMSHSAMRYKHLEAYNLRESFSSTSASNYELSSCQLSNSDETISLSLNLSRLHKSGNRLDISNYCHWVKSVFEKISTYTDNYTYLSRFATPISYLARKAELKPISLLFIVHRIEEYYSEYATDIVLEYKKKTGDKVERQIPLETLIKYLSATFLVEEKGSKLLVRRIWEKNKVYVGELSLSENGIKFLWTLNSKVSFVLKTGKKTFFQTVINDIQALLVYFQDCELRYADKKLFEDNHLVQSIPSFLEVFEGKVGLNTTTSEKGNPKKTSRQFQKDTIFRFIMDQVKDKYLVLDDLGTEWGDFIGIEGDTVTLYVAKSNHKRVFSASSFQESTAQGLKNIGSFYPPDRLLDSKKKSWSKMYKDNTKISKIRGGVSSDLVIDAWKKAIHSPWYKKRLVIVTDCISKDVLKKKMEKLQAGDDFPEKKEAIPMLWLISSFISSCVENGIEPKIYCKE